MILLIRTQGDTQLWDATSIVDVSRDSRTIVEITAANGETDRLTLDDAKVELMPRVSGQAR